MAFDARLRKARQVLVGDGGDIGDVGAEIAEAGAEDDADAGFFVADAFADNGGGVVGIGGHAPSKLLGPKAPGRSAPKVKVLRTPSGPQT